MLVCFADVISGKKKLLYQVVQFSGGLTLELVPLVAKSINKENVFILDCGSKIFQWNGSKSRRICRAYAYDVTSRILSKRESKELKVERHEVNETPASTISNMFWDNLGEKQPLRIPSSNVPLYTSTNGRNQAQNEKKYPVDLYRLYDCSTKHHRVMQNDENLSK